MSHPLESLPEHLRDLRAIAESTSDVGINSAKDVAVSIENVCKNATDDELSGAVSVLFESTHGLPLLMLLSLENARRNEAAESGRGINIACNRSVDAARHCQFL